MKEYNNIDYSVGRFSVDKKEVEKKRREAEAVGGDPEKAEKLLREKAEKANVSFLEKAGDKDLNLCKELLTKKLDKKINNKTGY